MFLHIATVECYQEGVLKDANWCCYHKVLIVVINDNDNNNVFTIVFINVNVICIVVIIIEVINIIVIIVIAIIIITIVIMLQNKKQYALQIIIITYLFFVRQNLLFHFSKTSRRCKKQNAAISTCWEYETASQEVFIAKMRCN